MKFVSKCVFLKLEEGKSKAGNYYMSVSLLDEDNNSNKFFIFGEDLQNKFKNSNLEGLKSILDVAFEAFSTQNGYGLRILDFRKVEQNNGNGNGK